MKHRRFKQILSIIGIAVIAGLYITTLVLAITGSEKTQGLFIASIFCTVMIPLIMYILSWLYKRLKSDIEETYEDRDE